MNTRKILVAIATAVAVVPLTHATVHFENTSETENQSFYVSDSCYWEHHLHKTTTETSSHEHYEYSYYYGTASDPTCEFYEYTETDTTTNITHDDVDEVDSSLTISLIELAPGATFDQADYSEDQYTDFSEDPGLNYDLHSEDGDTSNPDYGYWDTDDTEMSTDGYESYLRTHTFV